MTIDDVRIESAVDATVAVQPGQSRPILSVNLGEGAPYQDSSVGSHRNGPDCTIGNLCIEGRIQAAIIAQSGQRPALTPIDGSTQRLGDRIRVNVRLFHRGHANAIWGETYDADPSQIFALQDRIAGEISEALAVSPQPIVSVRSSPCEGEDIQAYRAYLTGLRQVQAPSPASLRSAIGAFERAIALDPECARAWAGLSSGASQALALLGIAYARGGRETEAEAILERMEYRSEPGYMPATSHASSN